jgi:hypothetical protein
MRGKVKRVSPPVSGSGEGIRATAERAGGDGAEAVGAGPFDHLGWRLGQLWY